MKKYFLIAVLSFCFGISQACAQGQATTRREQATVVNDSAQSSAVTPRGTISRAGKYESSVYTPPAAPANNGPAQGIPASSGKEQPAAVDPKKE